MEIGVKRDDGTWFLQSYWFALDETGCDEVDDLEKELRDMAARAEGRES